MGPVLFRLGIGATSWKAPVQTKAGALGAPGLLWRAAESPLAPLCSVGPPPPSEPVELEVVVEGGTP